jgi:hypothetical protein
MDPEFMLNNLTPLDNPKAGMITNKVSDNNITKANTATIFVIFLTMGSQILALSQRLLSNFRNVSFFIQAVA